MWAEVAEMTRPVLYEKITVTWMDSAGHLNTEYATGFYRKTSFYEDRLERGWMTLDERIAAKEARNG